MASRPRRPAKRAAPGQILSRRFGRRGAGALPLDPPDGAGRALGLRLEGAGRALGEGLRGVDLVLGAGRVSRPRALDRASGARRVTLGRARSVRTGALDGAARSGRDDGADRAPALGRWDGDGRTVGTDRGFGRTVGAARDERGSAEGLARLPVRGMMLGRRVSGAPCGATLLEGRSWSDGVTRARGWLCVRGGETLLEGRSVDRVEGVAGGEADLVPRVGATRAVARSRSFGVTIRPEGRADVPGRALDGATLAPGAEADGMLPRRTSVRPLAGAIRPEGRGTAAAVRSWAIRVLVGLAAGLPARRTAVRDEARYPGSSLYLVDQDNGEGRWVATRVRPPYA